MLGLTVALVVASSIASIQSVAIYFLVVRLMEWREAAEAATQFEEDTLRFVTDVLPGKISSSPDESATTAARISLAVLEYVGQKQKEAENVASKD